MTIEVTKKTDNGNAFIRFLSTARERCRYIWWSLIGEMNNRLDKYNKFQSLHEDILYGLMKIHHLQPTDKMTLGITHKVRMMYVLCVGKFNNAFEIDDTILLTKEGRDKVTNTLLECAEHVRNDVHGMYDALLDIADRVNTLDIHKYSVPSSLSSASCTAFLKE